MLSLGTLAADVESFAYGVSRDGSVIVGRSWSSLGNRAFVWRGQDGGMVALHDLLVSRGADVTGWLAIEVALAVSPDGRFVVGQGNYLGSPCAFIADLGPTEQPQDTDADGVPDYVDNCVATYNSAQADCNDDGFGDVCEIASGATDINLNDIPDSCECIADLVLADHKVNGADLGALLSQWGPAPAGTMSDINRDGRVSGADLGYLLNAWGPCSN
jgi:probable HAF family extracellular repeat protein